MIQNKQPFMFRFRTWVRTHKKLAVSLSIVLALLIGGGVATALYFLTKPAEAPAPQKTVTPEPEPEPVVYYSPLTGNVVNNQAATTQAATAIMIENSPDARPQSGLKNSGVVFEAIAEGGITRFLVLYQQEKPDLIGPVRSLRMYYVDWLAPFNASVAHVGGSAAALSEIRNGSYRDIDQFFNPATYWRATDRYAPHNVYTNFELLDQLNDAKGYTTSEFIGFTRKDSEANETPSATSIDVTMSSYLYNSHYDYNAETNLYDRSQGGGPHTDREAGQISPRVVIVMKVPMQLVMEDGWREQINTIGSGQAYIFQDGTVQEVTWNKASRTEQLTFTDAEGKDVALARGQTWISAVPSDTGGVTWQ
ncbi:hypothetical protein CL689_05800 [Candidatus Saccharibacteria bacterium]|nr:hypothetical protein [Candidatus Saccharibacteria bacterium]MBJ58861.1 hypothetical protein [Candidatus Saccharibacteria bacterium]MBQ69556.1 hypothetical protein [Candidatus Saccharibacteria bacterium]|tara:strand:+ start:879 stop:1970 length:1092 start_codon:yes stop_codon:yes gene_type:complete